MTTEELDPSLEIGIDKRHMKKDLIVDMREVEIDTEEEITGAMGNIDQVPTQEKEMGTTDPTPGHSQEKDIDQEEIVEIERKVKRRVLHFAHGARDQDTQ